jgi:hypothetical protein
MEPTLWTGFVFFGIPLALGLLGLFHSSRVLYRQLRRGRDAGTRAENAPGKSAPAASSRRSALRYGALFVGSALLVAHSGRWLLRIYGLL